MKIDKKIQLKARKKFHNDDEKRKYFELCFISDICPKCGNKLINNSSFLYNIFHIKEKYRCTKCDSKFSYLWI